MLHHLRVGFILDTAEHVLVQMLQLNKIMLSLIICHNYVNLKRCSSGDMTANCTDEYSLFILLSN